VLLCAATQGLPAAAKISHGPSRPDWLSFCFTPVIDISIIIATGSMSANPVMIKNGFFFFIY
jgi:hypothetical protein